MTLRSGSLDAAYGTVEQCNAKLLGLEPSFSGLSLANGLVLYMPVSEICTITFILYTADKFYVTTSTMWYFFAVVLSVALFVASPPVPGVNLLAYVALFRLLGIPGDALIDAMVFDIVIGIFAGAANQTLLQMELIRQADKIGMLNHGILRRKKA